MVKLIYYKKLYVIQSFIEYFTFFTHEIYVFCSFMFMLLCGNYWAVKYFS